MKNSSSKRRKQTTRVIEYIINAADEDNDGVINIDDVYKIIKHGLVITIAGSDRQFTISITLQVR